MHDDLYLMRARDDATKALRTARTIDDLDDAFMACQLSGVTNVYIVDDRAPLPLPFAYWYRAGNLDALSERAPVPA